MNGVLSGWMGGDLWWQVLLLVVVLLVVGVLLRRLYAPASSEPLVGMPVAVTPGTSVAVPKGYSPVNVGNDASARPWESLAEVSVVPAEWSARPAPDGFDVEAFLKVSKTNFMNLQKAWDSADIQSLSAMMTEAMLADIQSQLSERQKTGAGAGRSDVVMLNAQLLDIEEQEHAHLASVEFSGVIREDAAGPSPFREIWTITRPRSGGGDWLVSGVQALQ